MNLIDHQLRVYSEFLLCSVNSPDTWVPCYETQLLYIA